ncbi:MAG: hypothetical protein OEZ06_02100 [Myxococcales bacterium]|nr:hypothetical protein [Myxococcales bacterium]
MRPPYPISRHLLLALLLCVSAPAAAQKAAAGAGGPAQGEAAADAESDPSERDRKARERFEQGRSAYEEGRYRDAWEHFREAYLLSGRPQLLYNVGQSADRLRLDAQALDAFRLYLKHLPDAENRREVENRIRALEARQQGDAVPEAPAEGEGGDEPAGEGAGADVGAEADGATASGTDAATATEEAVPQSGRFYLRLSLGAGGLASSVKGLAGNATASASSSIGLLDLRVGYGIHPKLVFGLAAQLALGLSPQLEVDRGPLLGSSKEDLERLNASLLGVFVEFYLKPSRRGFRFNAAFSGGRLSISDEMVLIDKRDATGGALMLGAGYDFRVAEAWAMGVAANLTVASFSNDPLSYGLWLFALQFSAAWY